jgi:hypothetical protein
MMIPMLTIERVRPFNVSVDVTVDEYVPLTATTSSAPLAVAYYTVGHGVTSLVEIKIEQVSRLVRETVLVMFQETIEVSALKYAPIIEGLPVVAASSVPDFRTHVDSPFTVSVSADTVCIDWSAGRPVEFVTRQDKLSFLVGGNELLGALVTDLSPRQIEQLRGHAGGNQTGRIQRNGR